MSEIPAGAMRFNSDSQKLEYWNDPAWFQVHTATPNLANAGDTTPGARGLLCWRKSILPDDNAVNLITVFRYCINECTRLWYDIITGSIAGGGVII